MANRKKGNGKGGPLQLYRSYNFVDKDPVIDKVRNIIKHEDVSYAQVSRISGVSHTTLHNWFDGGTRRPQYATIMAVTRSLGYEQNFIKKHKINVQAEIEKLAKQIEKSAQ